MDDNNNSQLFAFDSPKNQSSYIKVIGVGGGGNNAVNHMFRKGITGVDFIVSNTDMKALNGSPVPNKLVLGHDGMGAGGRPIKARKAAEEKEAEIKELFEHNTKMIFITAGMGGGTGTGAAPVIARFAKEIQLEDEDEDETGRILVVAVVTTPFQFEGNRRIQQALEGVEELRKYVDSILVINNEKLRGYGNLVMSDAFSMANDVLLTAVKGIAEIITLNAYVNIDFRDVNTVMENSGTALMGIGEGEGENRARQAMEQATTSVLLDDNDIAGAKNVLLYFSYGPEHEITMDEMSEVTDYLREKTGSADTNVIWGTGFDEALGEKVKITLIATGFEQKEKPAPTVHVLKEKPVDVRPIAPAGPTNEPYITTRPSAPSAPEADTTQQAPQNVVDTLTKPAIEQVRPQTDAVKQPVRNVIPLYGKEDLDEDKQRPTVNDDGLRIINRPNVEEKPAPAPAAPAPAPAPASRPTFESAHRSAAPTRLDIEAMDRAERIKAMHDLLRNDVNGPAIIESMNPVEITGEHLHEITHSSESEMANAVLNPDGTIKRNNFFYEKVD
ncbi:MAG: cell division protein FtsZ [Bacteroidales bacterium]|nr:cell division protein FtsZ [Bacteroidales bacterium]